MMSVLSCSGFKMSKQGCGGPFGVKFQISRGLPVGAMINCADSTGANNLSIISVDRIKGQLNRLPVAGVGDTVVATELGKKAHPAVGIHPRKSDWRKAGMSPI